MTPLKLLIHDYAGHPFQADLSRELARRGHEVTHAYFADDIGPKGRLTRERDDPAGLRFDAVRLAGLSYSKSNFFMRRRGDLAYGAALAARIARLRPDLVLSGNTPTEAQQRIMRACEPVGAAFVYWCQDFYSIAASRILQRKLPGPGHIVAAYYRSLERAQMRRAAHIVHITEAFKAQTRRWGVSPSHESVIENWGPLNDLPVMDRDTAWAREQGLDGARVIYTGTLAMKHDPDLLAGLATGCEADIVVVAAGVGADALAKRAVRASTRVHLLPLQPFDRFAEVLASADVLVAVIEREAGAFSAPSKVLSYLCAGRPIVLSAPRDNLAARILHDSGAGRVVEPGDRTGFQDAVNTYLTDLDAARAAGRAGRAYAEAHFDIARVADQFEAVFSKAHATNTP